MYAPAASFDTSMVGQDEQLKPTRTRADFLAASHVKDQERKHCTLQPADPSNTVIRGHEKHQGHLSSSLQGMQSVDVVLFD